MNCPNPGHRTPSFRSAGIQGADLGDLGAEMGRRHRGGLCPVPFTLEEDACRPTVPLSFGQQHHPLTHIWFRHIASVSFPWLCQGTPCQNQACPCLPGQAGQDALGSKEPLSSLKAFHHSSPFFLFTSSDRQHASSFRNPVIRTLSSNNSGPCEGLSLELILSF